MEGVVDTSPISIRWFDLTEQSPRQVVRNSMEHFSDSKSRFNELIPREVQTTTM